MARRQTKQMTKRQNISPPFTPTVEGKKHTEGIGEKGQHEHTGMRE